MPVAVPALLAVILVFILFRVPQPTIPVGLPYKVELLLAVFTAGVLGYLRIAGITRYQIFGGIGGNLRLITTAIGGFVVWSGISAYWSHSGEAAIQHTLLWAVYLVLFLLFTAIIRLENGVRTVVSVLAFTALILGILCVLDYLTLVDFAADEGNLRIRYGKYAELLVTLLPVLWAATVYSRRRSRMLILSSAAVIGWMTAMLSLSKGAFLAGIAGNTLFFLGCIVFSSKTFRKRMLALAGVWIIVTILTQVLFSAFTAIPSTTDYISGKADPTRTTTDMRRYTWAVGRQMARDHWLFGVGSNNFGPEFNAARASLRLSQPDEPKTEIGEDYLTERAHNEPLQVLAELGVVGFTLFALPFALFLYIGFRKFWRDGRKLSPMTWACAAGMLAFAVSSSVSSFSFRAAQNGVVFFIVFAIAMNELRKPRRNVSVIDISLPIYAFSWITAVVFIVFCLTKCYAEYQVYQGEWTESSAAAQARFRVALKADPRYSGAYLSIAARNVRDDDPAAAALQTRKAIDTGIGLSVTYSALAKQQIAAGDNAGALATYHEALTIYPRSIFIRIEYAVLLEKLGNMDETGRQLSIARSMNLQQANGWYMIIKAGSVATFYEAQKNKEIAEPNALIPAVAVVQYIDKPIGK